MKYLVLNLMTLLCWWFISGNDRAAEYAGGGEMSLYEKNFSQILWTGFIITIICFGVTQVWLFRWRKKRLLNFNEKQVGLNNYSITCSLTISILVSFIISTTLIVITYTYEAWFEVFFAFLYVAPAWLPGILLILWAEHREKRDFVK